MESRQARVLLLGLIAGGIVFGVAMEATMDPLEASNLAWIGLLVGSVAFAAVGGYWYVYKPRRLSAPDERFQEIELRASRLSHGALTFALGVVAVVLLLPWVQAPVAAILWALVFGSVALHEASIEYYRRTM